MSSPLEMLKGVNHGFAVQQTRPGRTRGGLSLLQPVRPPRGRVPYLQNPKSGLNIGFWRYGTIALDYEDRVDRSQEKILDFGLRILDLVWGLRSEVAFILPSDS
jgi:hypothetical protein